MDEYPVGEIFVIPVRLDKCQPVDERLQDLQSVDLFLSYENGLKTLMRALGHETGQNEGSQNIHIHISGDARDNNIIAGREITAGIGTAPDAKPAAPGPGPAKKIDKRVLREAVANAFSLDDLEILCANIENALEKDGIQMQLDLETVGGNKKEIKVLNLINHLDRPGHLDYFVSGVREMRPGIAL